MLYTEPLTVIQLKKKKKAVRWPLLGQNLKLQIPAKEFTPTIILHTHNTVLSFPVYKSLFGAHPKLDKYFKYRRCCERNQKKVL